MKAYVTTIGEKTTDICCEQLERFGFEVLVLRGEEPWPQKYQRFITSAIQNVGEGGCIRVDADVILNKNIIDATRDFDSIALGYKRMPYLMAQWQCYDFYRNNVGVCSPVYYSKEALEVIKEDFNQLDLRRPEATAWRLPKINKHTYSGYMIVGMHGFFQDGDHLARHLENKIERKQMEEYDFDLAKRLMAL